MNNVHKGQIKADYYSNEKVVLEYDQKRFLRGGGAYVAKKETEIISNFLKEACLAGENIIMDCPVGTGRFLPLINQFSEHIIAVDVSSAMLKIASRYNAEEFIESSAEDISVLDDSIDFWVSSRFFFHFSDLDPFFSEADRVIKSGGFFAFDVFSWSPRSLLPKFLLGGKTYNHKEDCIILLSRKYGFDVVVSKKAFLIPTYIASFLPNIVVTLIENISDKIAPNFKTKNYYLLRKK